MGKLEKILPGQGEATWPEGLVEKEELEKWQRYFSGIASVFLCAVDNAGVPLTELSGEPGQAQRMEQFIDGEQFQSMLQRVAQSRLEDQAVERTAYPNLRLGVATSRLEGRPVVNWLICAVMARAEDEGEYENPPLEGFSCVPDEKQFLKVVDTLRALTDELLTDKLTLSRAERKSAKSFSARQDVEARLRRSELLREMMWLLVSEETADTVLQRLLKMLGEYLSPGIIAVYTMKKEQTWPKVASRWEKEPFPALFPAKNWSPILMVEKTLILSYNSTVSEGEREQLDALGLTGMIVMPGKVNEEENFWVCLGEKRERVWELWEIRFMGEAVKILQSVLKKRGPVNPVKRKPASDAGRRKKK